MKKYEKHGLMVKITNPNVVSYFRSVHECNTHIAEKAVAKIAGIPYTVPPFQAVKSKNMHCQNGFAVKINNQEIIDYIVERRQKHGVNHNFTVESAVLKMMRA